MVILCCVSLRSLEIFDSFQRVIASPKTLGFQHVRVVKKLKIHTLHLFVGAHWGLDNIHCGILISALRDHTLSDRFLEQLYEDVQHFGRLVMLSKLQKRQGMIEFKELFLWI